MVSNGFDFYCNVISVTTALGQTLNNKSTSWDSILGCSEARPHGRSQMVQRRMGRESVWSPHLEQLCVWQTSGLLTTHRQEPSCSTAACQLSTQTGLWESRPSVYQNLDVTPLFQTSMPPLSPRTSPQRSGPSKVGVVTQKASYI